MSSSSVVRGRAVNVRPRGDGSYAVTLVGGSAARQYGWFSTRTPIRLGALVEFEGAQLEFYKHAQGKSASVTIIRGGDMRILPDPWARRFVPLPWQQAVKRATNHPLYPHQIEGAAWVGARISQGQGCLLADDQGLGKTVQVLAGLLVARAFPAIVVCPSSLKINWQLEVAKHLRVDLQVTVVDGNQGPIEPAHIVVLNYDLLRERENQLIRLGARAIVLDEAHGLKKPDADDSHRASVATRIAKTIGRAVLLTGTPMPNKPHELWRLLHIVSPHEWPNYDDFKKRYCLRPDDDEVFAREVITTHGRVHNLDELQVRMAPMVLRRLKKDVLTQLPPKRRRSITVELTDSDRAHYDKAEKDVRAWLRGIGRQVSGTTEGQTLVKLQMLRRIAAMGKLRHAVPQYLHKYFEGGAPPLIIFGYHRDVIRGVRQICSRMGLRVGGIGSQDPPERRQRAIDSLTDGDLDVFIAPIRAAGVGINLQAASNMFFLERLWVPSAMVQAEDRCHRMGQHREVRIDYLDAARTVDEHIARVLAQKQKLIDAIVDDKERPDDQQLTRETLAAVIESMAHGS
jgi:SWI/SNF-related matrix-associated actin-dependent regulator 1 of chromatin subfamily A